jgi:hypothetical protein
MGLLRKILSFVALYLLASAAMAYAECAWVLWEQSSFPNDLGWRILQTYEARADCAIDHAKLMSPNSAWHAAYEPFNADSVIQRLPTGAVIVKRALCLPDAVDQRGSKGK